MSKDPYKIVDSKPSWSSRLGSGVVALGSVATAVVITVPGLPGYEFLSQSGVAFDGVSVPAGAQAPGTENSADNGLPVGATSTLQQFGITTSGAASLGGSTSSPQTQATLTGAPNSAGQTPASLSLPGVSSGNTSSPTPWSSGGTGVNTPAAGSIASGNTTSPTPYSSGGTGASAPASGGTSTGNTSSPTPGGSASEYEDEDEYEYENEYEYEEDED